MQDAEKSKYFYRGRSQNWKTCKFRILTPCARGHAYRHHTYISYFHNRFQQLGQTPQKCPPPDTKPLAPTVYPLQGRKVDPNFKKNFGKQFFSSTTTRKIRWIHWWNLFSNPFTITGDICNFVTAMSALSNTQCSVYNYARRPILRTALRPVQLFSSYILLSVQFSTFAGVQICSDVSSTLVFRH